MGPVAASAVQAPPGGEGDKLTDERIEMLEAAGFEWALLPGSTKDDEEEDDEMDGYEEEDNEIGKEEI